MALLGLLLEYRRQDPSLRLCAAHVHHGLRGQDADLDERLVSDFCRTRNVEFAATRVEVRTRKGNTEAVARRLRYDFLASIAAPREACVLTAHTLNDQAETFLLKLCRGAGPSGLSGIRRRRLHRDPLSGRAVPVVRPLLDISHPDLVDWLQSNQVPSRTDATNADLGLRRNRLRHQLLPELAAHLNPRIMEQLARTAGIFAELDDFLSRLARLLVTRRKTDLTPGPALPAGWLTALHPALQRQVVRTLLQQLPGTRASLHSNHLETVLKLARGRSGRDAWLPGPLRVSRDFEHLVFHTSPPVPPFAYFLQLPGEVEIPELGCRLTIVAAEPESADFRSEAAGLTVRNRRTGDRFAGASAQPRKLKRLFNQLQIPRWQRDRLLILEEAGRIVWVQGIPAVAGPSAGSRAWQVRLSETFSAHPASN